MTALTVNFNPIIELTDDQFYKLCRVNPDVKFERNAKGELIIMSPTGGETRNRNFEMYIDLGIWNRQIKRMLGFTPRQYQLKIDSNPARDRYGNRIQG